MKAAALLLLVAVTHYGYPDPASWWFYILRGIEGAVLFLVIAWHSKGLLFLAALWGALEEAQTGVCGYLSMNEPTTDQQLCIQAFGPWPYALLAATAIVYLWGNRDRKN